MNLSSVANLSSQSEVAISFTEGSRSRSDYLAPTLLVHRFTESPWSESRLRSGVQMRTRRLQPLHPTGMLLYATCNNHIFIFNDLVQFLHMFCPESIQVQYSLSSVVAQHLSRISPDLIQFQSIYSP